MFSIRFCWKKSLSIIVFTSKNHPTNREIILTQGTQRENSKIEEKSRPLFNDNQKITLCKNLYNTNYLLTYIHTLQSKN